MKKYLFGAFFITFLSSCSLFSPESSLLVPVSDEGVMKKHLATHKFIVLDVFATFCAPCKALVPILTELAEKYEYF